MAKAATKSPAATVRVPQTREQTTEAIAAIGRHQRERARIEAAMNDAIAAIKQQHEEAARPHAEAIRALSEGVQTWCEAHRDELTDNRRTKTANLASGEVKWRLSPPKVVLKGIEKVLETLRARRLTDMIRVKEEVNKEAILADPAAVSGIKGIRIEQDELFVIEPFETKLEEIA